MKVFVHGNPETAAVWSPLLDLLAASGVGDVVTLSPPGFGAPLPDGFGATADDYAAWLADELTALISTHGVEIDLVGHDWGAGHVLRVVADQPALIRSWAVDCGALVHPDYEWHDAARTWQEPGAGEEAVALLAGMSAVERTELFTSLGLPEVIATSFANAVDEAMGRAILGLYRSAAQPYLRDLGERLASTADRPPGLVVVAEQDADVAADLGRDVADRLGADTVAIDAGHWWMASHPGPAASGLQRFWAAFDGA
jgi:pimeloyl-ACP methyl ester carboxylesterase